MTWDGGMQFGGTKIFPAGWVSDNFQVVRKTGPDTGQVQVYTEINIAKLYILALTALHCTGIVWVLEEK